MRGERWENGFRPDARQFLVLVFAVFIAMEVSPAAAQGPAAASESYSLEYVSVAASGAAVKTADYAVVSQVQTKKCSGPDGGQQ